MNYFEELNSVDVSEWIEKKNGLSYVSWANAWKEIKKRHPDATYYIYENKDGFCYHTDGKYCWVKTGVTVNEIEHIEYLPVMDFRNKSIPLENVTSMDVNKAIQRSLTKACARHGLGLYVYAGEDLPEKVTNSDEPVVEIVGENKVSLIDMIRACKTEDEISKLYKEHKKEICDNDNLLEAVTIKGKALKGVA